MNVRLETIKLQEENTDGNILDISLGDFLDLTAKAKATKAKTNKWDYKASVQQRKPSTK